MNALPCQLIDERRAGLLLHPSSLPSGCLDNDAERWLDQLAASGMRVWQMLPLGLPDPTGSPYQSCSSFALNPGLLPPNLATTTTATDYQDFLEQQRHWLIDYARYQILKTQHAQHPWYHWPDAYKQRDPAALARLDQQHADAIQAHCQQQHALQSRWAQIRQYAAERDILLFGDLPIYVALDSADVWAQPEQFLLDDQGQATHVTGVPPDYFSETGQRWGNPHYRWEHMQADGFAWWKARLERQLQLYDLIRLDHFRALEAAWMIPADSPTAIDGYWQPSPGDALLQALIQALQNSDTPHRYRLPIVAEDLGLITPDVTALRQRYQLPGMSVLQFAFDAYPDNPHIPQNIHKDRVVYSGTHDNDTTQGWFQTLSPEQQHNVFQTLKSPARDDIHRLLIETAFASDACLAIIPLQDLLGLGSQARLNTPGTTNDPNDPNTPHNWQWRFHWRAIDRSQQQWLKHQAQTHQRLA